MLHGIAGLLGQMVPIWRYLPKGAPTKYKRYVDTGKRVIDLVRPIVEERRKLRDADPSFEAACFIDMLLEEAPQYTAEEVAWNAAMILGAGYDTTSNTLAFTSLVLASREDLQSRLRAEIDGAVGDDGALRAAHVMKLPLLNMILKESMRLYPAAPLIARLYEGDDAWTYGDDAFSKDRSAIRGGKGSCFREAPL